MFDVYVRGKRLWWSDEERRCLQSWPAAGGESGLRVRSAIMDGPVLEGRSTDGLTGGEQSLSLILQDYEVPRPTRLCTKGSEQLSRRRLVLCWGVLQSQVTQIERNGLL